MSMNLFWQITLIEFLLNVAIFSGAVILYGPVGTLAGYVSGGREVVSRAAFGVLFGAATAVALLLPIHLEGGAAVGCTTILLAIAGPLDGWVAAVVGVGVSVAVETLPWAATRQSDHVAIMSLLASAVLGLGFRYALVSLPGRHNRELQYVHLPLLGIVSAAGGVMVLGLSQGMSEVPSSILPAIVSNTLAAGGLGTLLLHEKLRSKAERELRQSEANLAGQANELAVARDNADAANRAKSVFLANMSHELRTPLNAILGYAQLLQRDRNLTAWQANASRTIEQSGEHLLTLITDILDLSKIEAGKIDMVLAPVDLRDFIRGLSDIIRIKAEEKALEYTYTIGSDLPLFVQADEKRLRQVLLNVLSNSVKFTDRGQVHMSVMTLSLADGQRRLRFEVKDTGIGMSASQLKLIFQPFVQVGDERHRYGGTGLGLNISRQLVGLMGGSIQVESTLGQGSRFFFDIPELQADSTGMSPKTLGEITGYTGSRKSVLIVDDTDESRQMLADTLGSVGFEVSQASNGSDALAAVRSIPPDLVFMDIRMPVMNGIEAMVRMQKDNALSMIPVIAVSAGATDEERISCQAAGVKVFLTKPIEIAALLDEVGKILGLKWIREDRRTPVLPEGEVIQRFVVPDAGQMASLRDAAMTGNMRAVREKAGQFIALDEKYRPFAEKVIQLTLAYQTKAILRLVEKQFIQNQVEPVDKA